MRRRRLARCLLLVVSLSSCGRDSNFLGYERLPVVTGAPEPSGSSDASSDSPPDMERADAGASGHGQTNHFNEVLGVTDAEVLERLNAGFDQLFYGDKNNEAIYYEVDDGAYIYDVLHGDTRMDALGYGMMVCVQLDHQKEFDNIWSYALEHLRYGAGPAAGYFHPICPLSGGECSSGHSRLGLFFAVTALLFAEKRWGDSGRFSYSEEAREQLRLMREKEVENDGIVDGVTNLFHEETALPARLSDEEWEVSTSAIMPAFFSVWADHEDDPFWERAADAGRELLIRAAHPRTGLFGEVTALDGTYPLGDETQFRDSSYVVFLALALDYSWNGPNTELEDVANRVIRFFSKFGDSYVAEYTLAGSQSNSLGSWALVAMNGSLAGIATVGEREEFVRRVWKAEIQRGTIRFFDGINQLMSLMYLGGQFRRY